MYLYVKESSLKLESKRLDRSVVYFSFNANVTFLIDKITICIDIPRSFKAWMCWWENKVSSVNNLVAAWPSEQSRHCCMWNVFVCEGSSLKLES